MTKEEKIKAIREIVAWVKDKTGKIFWCYAETHIGDVLDWRKRTLKDSFEDCVWDSLWELTIEKWKDWWDFEEIRDLEYCKNTILSYWLVEIMLKWTKFNAPISEQNEECINYVYNLIYWKDD